MAVSVAWGTKIILVPKADTTLFDIGPPEIRTYSVNTLRLALKDLEDDADGMGHLDTHSHNTEVTLGGLTFARTFEIINGYTVEFEDGTYTVRLLEANHNILDVAVANQVNLQASNSAGLVNLTDLTTVRKIIDPSKHVLSDGTTGNEIIYDDDGVTPFRTYDVVDETDSTIALKPGDPAKRTRQ